MHVCNAAKECCQSGVMFYIIIDVANCSLLSHMSCCWDECFENECNGYADSSLDFFPIHILTVSRSVTGKIVVAFAKKELQVKYCQRLIAMCCHS